MKKELLSVIIYLDQLELKAIIFNSQQNKKIYHTYMKHYAYEKDNVVRILTHIL